MTTSRVSSRASSCSKSTAVASRASFKRAEVYHRWTGSEMLGSKKLGREQRPICGGARIARVKKAPSGIMRGAPRWHTDALWHLGRALLAPPHRAIVEPGEACEAILEPQLVRHVARVRIVRVVRQLLRLRQLFGIALPVLAQRAHANHVGASDGNETTTRWLVAEGHQRGAAWKHRPTQRDTAPLGVRSDHEMEIAGARAAIELERVHAVAVRQVRRAFARGAQHERAGEEAIDEQVHHHAIVVDHRAGKAFLDGPSSRGRRGGGGAVDRP
eukprot:6535-Prymnesium_polylepis.1